MHVSWHYQGNVQDVIVLGTTLFIGKWQFADVQCTMIIPETHYTVALSPYPRDWYSRFHLTAACCCPKYNIQGCPLAKCVPLLCMLYIRISSYRQLQASVVHCETHHHPHRTEELKVTLCIIPSSPVKEAQWGMEPPTSGPADTIDT